MSEDSRQIGLGLGDSGILRELGVGSGLKMSSLHFLLVFSFIFPVLGAQRASEISTNSKHLNIQDESQELRKELAIVKAKVEEMLGEIKNQNHAIFRQADHSRILSGKVSNMSKELSLLKGENAVFRDRLQLNEFKAARRLKKVKAKLDILAAGVVQCCPSVQNMKDSTEDDEDMAQEWHQSVELPSRKEKKVERKRGKDDRKERRKKKKEEKRKRKQDKEFESRNSFGARSDYGSVETHHSPTLSRSDSPIPPSGREHHYGRPIDAPQRFQPQYSPENRFRTEIQDPGESSLMLITAGSSNSSEFLDLDSNGFSRCPNPPPFPFMIEGSFGTFIGSHPMICGGRSSVEDYSKRCFYYENTNNSWTETTTMLEPRFQASAVMIDPNRWWITSGFSGEKVYNTTEVYEVGVGFSRGPPMPSTTFQHCLVRLNSTHMFSVGGFPYTRNVWLMDFEAETWTLQRPIHHLRDAPHCARIERRNGKIEVIVAGGSLPGSELSTEIFSVTDNRWRTGTNLPQAIIYGVSLPFRNAMVILGGHEMGGNLEELDLIYQYDPTKEVWSVLNQRLQETRTSFVAVSLPETYMCSSFPLPATPTPYGYQPGSTFF